MFKSLLLQSRHIFTQSAKDLIKNNEDNYLSHIVIKYFDPKIVTIDDENA